MTSGPPDSGCLPRAVRIALTRRNGSLVPASHAPVGHAVSSTATVGTGAGPPVEEARPCRGDHPRRFSTEGQPSPFVFSHAFATSSGSLLSSWTWRSMARSALVSSLAETALSAATPSEERPDL